MATEVLNWWKMLKEDALSDGEFWRQEYQTCLTEVPAEVNPANRINCAKLTKYFNRNVSAIEEQIQAYTSQAGISCKQGCPPGTGQVANAAGTCGCREGTGQVQDAAGKCGCPAGSGQTLNVQGICGCSPGQKEVEGKCKETPETQAVNWAKDKDGDTSYVQKACSWKNILFCFQYKCNLFVADAFEKGGGVDFPYRTTFFGLIRTTPESANTLADPTKMLSHYPVITGGRDSLQPGDIVAFPKDTSSGHSGIYTGKNKYGEDEVIYAGDDDVVINSLDYVITKQGNIFTIRRYTP